MLMKWEMETVSFVLECQVWIAEKSLSFGKLVGKDLPGNRLQFSDSLSRHSNGHKL